MVARWLPKPKVRVRTPLSAPNYSKYIYWYRYITLTFQVGVHYYQVSFIFSPLVSSRLTRYNVDIINNTYNLFAMRKSSTCSQPCRELVSGENKQVNSMEWTFEL